MPLIQIEISEDLSVLSEKYQTALRRMGVKKTKQQVLEEIAEAGKATMKMKLKKLDATYEKALLEAKT